MFTCIVAFCSLGYPIACVVPAYTPLPSQHIGVTLLAHPYKIVNWAELPDKGQPDHEVCAVNVNFFAKRSSISPFEVFNELVAMQLGRYIGLPIPIGFVIDRGGELYYCSSDISIAGGEFPPADLSELSKRKPELYCGITVFDGWICNCDRHAKNIFFDEDRETVFLIDHGMALLNNYGIEHMRSEEDSLSIYGAFAREISDFSSFSIWRNKILGMPEYVISETVAQAADVGIEDSIASEVVSRLIKRRDTLRDLFEKNTEIFTNFDPGLFPPFGD